jgi:hypothetical protein
MADVVDKICSYNEKSIGQPVAWGRHRVTPSCRPNPPMLFEPSSSTHGVGRGRGDDSGAVWAVCGCGGGDRLAPVVVTAPHDRG